MQKRALATGYLSPSPAQSFLWWWPSKAVVYEDSRMSLGVISLSRSRGNTCVCFSSRPMVCAVSGSGLLSQGRMWVSFHGVGLNARETVVTPTTLGLVLEDCDHHWSPGAYANQATFRTSLRATHGSSLGGPSAAFPWAELSTQLDYQRSTTHDTNSSWTTAALKHRPGVQSK